MLSVPPRIAAILGVIVTLLALRESGGDASAPIKAFSRLVYGEG